MTNNLQRKITFSIARYFKVHVPRKNREKEKINKATNSIENNNNSKVVKYLYIKLYFLQKNL